MFCFLVFDASLAVSLFLFNRIAFLGREDAHKICFLTTLHAKKKLETPLNNFPPADLQEKPIFNARFAPVSRVSQLDSHQFGMDL